MSDRRASMMATLADIKSKPETPARLKAAANIEAALAAMDNRAAKTPRNDRPARMMTTYDREQAMRIVDDPSRSQAARDEAKSILDGDGNLTEGQARFLGRMGKGK